MAMSKSREALLKAFCARDRKSIYEFALKRSAELKGAQTIEDRANWWIAYGEVGRSSATIWHVMTGKPMPRVGWGAAPSRPDRPYDMDDWRRCELLLDLIPEWRPRLHEVVERYPAWREWLDGPPDSPKPQPGTGAPGLDIPLPLVLAVMEECRDAIDQLKKDRAARDWVASLPEAEWLGWGQEVALIVVSYDVWWAPRSGGWMWDEHRGWVSPLLAELMAEAVRNA